MTTIRSPKEPKGRSDGVMSDDDIIKSATRPQRNVNAKGVLDKTFDTVSRETRSATAKRMGAIPKTSCSVAFEIESRADPDVARPEEL